MTSSPRVDPLVQDHAAIRAVSKPIARVPEHCRSAAEGVEFEQARRAAQQRRAVQDHDGEDHPVPSKPRIMAQVGSVLLLTAALAGCDGSTPAADRTAAEPSPPPPADLVLLNGNVVTVDAQRPRAEAIAVTGDRSSAATPDHPVMLIHTSGHSVFVNAHAMALVGLDDSTAAPDGGEIVRDAEARATGMMRESAQDVFRQAYAGTLGRRPAGMAEQRLHRYVTLAGEESLRHGPERGAARGDRGLGGAGHRARLPDGDSGHRRPRLPRVARHLSISEPSNAIRTRPICAGVSSTPRSFIRTTCRARSNSA